MDTTMKIDHLSVKYLDGRLFMYHHMEDGSIECENPGGWEFVSSYPDKTRRRWLVKGVSDYYRLTTDKDGSLVGGYLVCSIERHPNLPLLFAMERSTQSDHAADSWLDE